MSDQEAKIDKTVSNSEPPKDVDSYLHTPVHEETFRFLLIAIPKRIIGLISKAIGIKMSLFAIATWLLISFPDTFPWYAWVIVYILTLFGWDGLKFIEKIKK